MAHDDFRTSQIREFEGEAEWLVAYQLDLLAQIESQLRGVHQTMRRIERLRNVTSRVGAELSNGERTNVLVGLSRELDALDKQLSLQHQSNRDMQSVIEKMQQRLIAVKQAAEKRRLDLSDDKPSVNPPEE
jgi:chaperonin cofactor prefoldin